jgi:cytochrome c oxidase assembly protein subunit 15
VRFLFLATTILIFLQLILGATMRHQHAGLAIPDFPLAYGKFWPAMDAAAVAAYNAARLEVTTANPITATQISLQMAHRLMAIGILACVGALAWRAKQWPADSPGDGGKATRPKQNPARLLRQLTMFWLGLIFIQAGLGAWTIWSQKAADVATAHVLGGALSLVTGVFGCLICFRHPAGIANATVVSTFPAAQPATRLSANLNL